MKRIVLLLLPVFILIITLLLVVRINEIVLINDVDISREKVKENKITKLKKKYKNNDIVGILEIPNVLKTVVVKHTNNEYYLNHNIRNRSDVKGAVFMDYRNTLNDKKILIYGHNSTRGNHLPFVKLDKYLNEKYYKKHKQIYFYTESGTRVYEIFSSYIEEDDFDYVNLNNYNGLTYLKHINKLKNKSVYNTNINLKEDSNIIILQTCNVESGYSDNKNTLVMGVI